MAESDGQRIRCIRRLWQLGKAQSLHDHPLDLPFVRPTVSGYRRFDLGGRVFVDRETGSCRSQQRYPGGPTNCNRRLEITVGEDLLDSDGIGAMFGDYLRQVCVEFEQPLLDGVGDCRPDHSDGPQSRPVGGSHNHPVSGCRQAGVYS
jgi:hypothetical protein